MYEFGGRKSLQVAFNVLNEGCGGCSYESYPYKAQLPVIIDGKRPIREFKSDDDVWEVVDLIIEETKEFNLECELYLGGKDGSKIYYGKPMIYDDNYTHFTFSKNSKMTL